MDYSDQEDLKIQKKAFNVKKQKVIENLFEVWIDLWRQYTQALKKHLQTHSDFTLTKTKSKPNKLVYMKI